MASIEQRWKGIKKAFESAAKKKRPSEKTLGVFNKPSGLTPASTEMDKAIAGGKSAEIAKALTKLRATAKAYLVTIAKSLASEKDPAGQALLKTMSDDLEAMIEGAQGDAEAALKIGRCGAPSDLLALMKDKTKGVPFLAYAKKTLVEPEIEFLLQMAAGKRTQAVYDAYLAPRAAKPVDVESEVRDEFEESIRAGDVSGAPWAKATDWILTSLNSDVIPKYNAEVARSLK